MRTRPTTIRDDGLEGRGEPAPSEDPRPRSPQHADITMRAREAVVGDGEVPGRPSEPLVAAEEHVALGAQATLRERRRRTAALGFHALCACAATVGVVTLVVLMYDV